MLSCKYLLLVGGLEHFLFSHILGLIIPIDQYFSEGFKPPTRLGLSQSMSWQILWTSQYQETTYFGPYERSSLGCESCLAMFWSPNALGFWLLQTWCGKRIGCVTGPLLNVAVAHLVPWSFAAVCLQNELDWLRQSCNFSRFWRCPFSSMFLYFPHNSVLKKPFAWPFFVAALRSGFGAGLRQVP